MAEQKKLKENFKLDVNSSMHEANEKNEMNEMTEVNKANAIGNGNTFKNSEINNTSSIGMKDKEIDNNLELSKNKFANTELNIFEDAKEYDENNKDEFEKKQNTNDNNNISNKHSEHNNTEQNDNKKDNEKQISSDLECVICMKLLIMPVTIPCGHNFCRDCLEKAKEYNGTCPLCRSCMGDKQNVNILLAELIKEKYPKEYAKRLKEIEIIRIEKEKKVLQERFDAIKNSSMIPIFKAPLSFGPYFPGEIFQINIYNKKFIDLIELVSNEGIFAITSNNNKHNDKMYGIHVKILERNDTTQAFIFKCVANYRVILYNIIYFSQYDYDIASHSPLFDESIPVNFFDYNLNVLPDVTKPETKAITSNTTASIISSTNTSNIKCRKESKYNLIDEEIIKLDALKKLLNKIEVEDDIKSISFYYEQYKDIVYNAKDISTNTSHADINNPIYAAQKYYSCIIFSRICLLCIKYQLNRFGNAGVRLFNTKFRNIKLTSSEPSNEELESFSFSLSSAIISRSIQKWSWFKTTNTTERLESITQYFLKKKNKSILALDNSRSPIIHRFFMLDSISSSLLILVFVSFVVFVKYFFYYNL
ncbi:RING zinc finger protein, putative [Plasmodium berghei]|uniref:RING zinc finger protein, putative n=2 Tax=Plasmodium berghei TaxID=5821 RepID=A0A509AK82_PLABA|nr:RING zinc finger protein, putative [Plasmodium berghei ANKA]CXI43487.1 RING zinc finger protein, putative [Plasmodium berghei]SCM22324.1 RING zinc finger protein, putative [Plasmodium berghei]SCN25386.1 RING zinc finger protein, putative [Plasmodium berghei]SCO60361.1 RING zinc finger protein, putative [Plasmodium berghei]SCO62099.1 RING zinc finger protein, putative [Plasmodium berghei]|eukprot:XP_034421600.1 RING zinc finger protein, putative [Plasmodium berghei ANKA]